LSASHPKCLGLVTTPPLASLPRASSWTRGSGADRALWHPHSPRVRVVRPAADGSFIARDLPAGAYRLAALHDVEEDEWRQAWFLETLVETSLPIVVEEGATTRQNIRIH
jgi:hypothetical protein